MGGPQSDGILLIDLFVPCMPVAKGQPRASSFGGRARLYTPARTRRFMEELAAAISAATTVRGVDRALEVSITVQLPKPASSRRHWPSVKPDADNYAKSVLDACTRAGIWRDDALVCRLTVEKRYGVPGVGISLIAI